MLLFYHSHLSMKSTLILKKKPIQDWNQCLYESKFYKLSRLLERSWKQFPLWPWTGRYSILATGRHWTPSRKRSTWLWFKEKLWGAQKFLTMKSFMSTMSTYMKKVCFLFSHPKPKVSRLCHLGTSRVLPWVHFTCKTVHWGLIQFMLLKSRSEHHFYTYCFL